MTLTEELEAVDLFSNMGKQPECVDGVELIFCNTFSDYLTLKLDAPVVPLPTYDEPDPFQEYQDHILVKSNDLKEERNYVTKVIMKKCRSLDKSLFKSGQTDYFFSMKMQVIRTFKDALCEEYMKKRGPWTKTAEVFLNGNYPIAIHGSNLVVL